MPTDLVVYWLLASNKAFYEANLVALDVDVILVYQVVQKHLTPFLVGPLGARNQLLDNQAVKSMRKRTVTQIMAQAC